MVNLLLSDAQMRRSERIDFSGQNSDATLEMCDATLKMIASFSTYLV